MAKFYGIAPVVQINDGGDTYWDCAFKNVPLTNGACRIPNDAQGDPLYNFAFAVVRTANVNALQLVSNSYLFPDYPLDGRLDGMGADARAAMVANVHAYNLDGNGFYLDTATHNQDALTYREFLQAVWEQAEPSFNINKFETSEPLA